MILCMTLSGHTSTLPRLVVWGAGFQGRRHFLDLTQTQISSQTGTYDTDKRGRMIDYQGASMIVHCRKDYLAVFFKSHFGHDAMTMSL